MDVPYREETPSGWAATVAGTWSIEKRSDDVRLYGDCPTCTHPTETIIRSLAIVPGTAIDGDKKSGAEAVAEPLLIVCDCRGESHPGRKDGLNGCGRAGYLDLVLEDGDS